MTTIDIYCDLDNIDLGDQIDKLTNENKRLDSCIRSQQDSIDTLCRKLKEMKAIQNNLSRNISELYNTAKREIERKNRRIAELEAKFDNKVFRRKPQFPEGDHKGETQSASNDPKGTDHAERLSDGVAQSNTTKNRIGHQSDVMQNLYQERRRSYNNRSERQRQDSRESRRDYERKSSYIDSNKTKHSDTNRHKQRPLSPKRTEQQERQAPREVHKEELEDGEIVDYSVHHTVKASKKNIEVLQDIQVQNALVKFDKPSSSGITTKHTNNSLIPKDTKEPVPANSWPKVAPEILHERFPSVCDKPPGIRGKVSFAPCKQPTACRKAPVASNKPPPPQQPPLPQQPPPPQPPPPSPPPQPPPQPPSPPPQPPSPPPQPPSPPPQPPSPPLQPPSPPPQPPSPPPQPPSPPPQPPSPTPPPPFTSEELQIQPDQHDKIPDKASTASDVPTVIFDKLAIPSDSPPLTSYKKSHASDMSPSTSSQPSMEPSGESNIPTVESNKLPLTSNKQPSECNTPVITCDKQSTACDKALVLGGNLPTATDKLTAATDKPPTSVDKPPPAIPDQTPVTSKKPSGSSDKPSARPTMQKKRIYNKGAKSAANSNSKQANSGELSRTKTPASTKSNKNEPKRPAKTARPKKKASEKKVCSTKQKENVEPAKRPSPSPRMRSKSTASPTPHEQCTRVLRSNSRKLSCDESLETETKRKLTELFGDCDDDDSSLETKRFKINQDTIEVECSITSDGAIPVLHVTDRSVDLPDYLDEHSKLSDNSFSQFPVVTNNVFDQLCDTNEAMLQAADMSLLRLDLNTSSMDSIDGGMNFSNSNFKAMISETSSPRVQTHIADPSHDMQHSHVTPPSPRLLEVKTWKRGQTVIKVSFVPKKSKPVNCAL